MPSEKSVWDAVFADREGHGAEGSDGRELHDVGDDFEAELVQASEDRSQKSFRIDGVQREAGENGKQEDL